MATILFGRPHEPACASASMADYAYPTAPRSQARSESSRLGACDLPLAADYPLALIRQPHGSASAPAGLHRKRWSGRPSPQALRAIGRSLHQGTKSLFGTLNIPCSAALNFGRSAVKSAETGPLRSKTQIFQLENFPCFWARQSSRTTAVRQATSVLFLPGAGGRHRTVVRFSVS
jgi:hypothetical protein